MAPGTPMAREGELPLRALLETAHDFIASLDADGRWTYVNAAARRIYGYDPQEMIGRPFTDFADPEQAAHDLPAFRRVVGGQRVEGHVTVHRRKDGSPVVIVFNAVPVLGDDGNVVGVTTTGADITERSRADSEVRAAGARLEAILDNASVAIYIKDRQGRYTFANRYVESFYGVPREELLGMTDADLLPAGPAAELMEADRAVLDTGRSVETEETVRGRTYISVKFPLEDADGTAAEVCGISTDITEQRRGSDELRRRADQQAALAELGARAFRAEHAAELSDDAARSVLKVLDVDVFAVYQASADRRELILKGWGDRGRGAPPPERVITQGAPRVLQAVDRPTAVVTSGSDPRLPPGLRYFAARFACFVAVPLVATGGLQGGIAVGSASEPPAEEIAFLQAIANVLATAFERERAQAALDDRNREIAELAAARGRLVVEALAAEDRERARLAETIHDHALQNLLAVRQDLVDAERRPEERQELVAGARQLVEETARSLRDLISSVHPVTLRHGGLETALTSLAESHARRGGFEAEVVVAEGVAGDHDALLLRIAGELLTNVEKHAQASRVDVSARRDGERIVLQVEDDGLGMDPRRGLDAVRAGHIGLASASERVKALGGSFRVSSTPGEGTRVRVELPAG